MKQTAIIRPLVVTTLLLLVPLFGNQFVEGWNWDFFDFVFAALLIFGTGFAYEVVSRKGGTAAYRAAVGLALGATFLLVWVNAAVGIIGSEANPANLLYVGVLAVGVLGAIISRLEPRKMSYTLCAMAAAQMLVPAVALLIWRPPFDTGVVAVFGLNAAFAALFVGSAILFRKSRGAGVPTGIPT